MSGGQGFLSIRADRGHGGPTGFIDVYVQGTSYGGTELEIDGAGGPVCVIAGGGPLFLRQTGQDMAVNASTSIPHRTLQFTKFGGASIIVASAGQLLPAPDIAIPSATGNTSYLSLAAGGNITMTGTPTIAAPPADGVLLLVQNNSDISGGTITLQDLSVLLGSGLAFAAGVNKALAWKQWVLLKGRGAVWYEVQ